MSISHKNTADITNPENLPANMSIDMVELGRGCGNMCVTCGAYADFSADRKLWTIPPEELRQNISQEILDARTDTRVKLVALFRKYITTGPDMEPTESDIFGLAARIIYEESAGESRLVWIGHGGVCTEKTDDAGNRSWAMIPSHARRIKEVDSLLLEGKVPLAVLSLDTARFKGLAGKETPKLHKEFLKTEELFAAHALQCAIQEQIDEGYSSPVEEESAEEWERRLCLMRRRLQNGVREKRKLNGDSLTDTEKQIAAYIDAKDSYRAAVVEPNAQSCAATLRLLLPSIRAGKRVTVSLQGDKDRKSRVYEGLTHTVWSRTCDILKEWGVEEEVLSVLKNNLQPMRNYYRVGCAKTELDIAAISDGCAMIPDEDFVREILAKDGRARPQRGKVGSDGGLFVQQHRPGNTYNDSITGHCPGAKNPWKRVDLSTEQFRSVQMAEPPKDFMGRIRYFANPRRIVLPPVVEEVSRESGVASVYPLSQVCDATTKEVGAILTQIEEYLNREGGGWFGEVEGGEVDVSRVRREIIAFLIPGDEVERGEIKEGEDLSAMVDEIVKYHTPKVSGAAGDAEKVGIMGEILAIKTLLAQKGVEIILTGEER